VITRKGLNNIFIDSITAIDYKLVFNVIYVKSSTYNDKF